MVIYNTNFILKYQYLAEKFPPYCVAEPFEYIQYSKEPVPCLTKISQTIYSMF